MLKKNFLVHSFTILQLFVWTPPGWSTAMQISPCQVLLWVREWLAPNLVISEKTNISFYSSKSWWPHPVSSRHGGWHGTTCWVLLEHILRCHDHNCDPREYSCPLYCYKYVLWCPRSTNWKQILWVFGEKYHYVHHLIVARNCHGKSGYWIKHYWWTLNATYLSIFTCSHSHNKIRKIYQICLHIGS